MWAVVTNTGQLLQTLGSSYKHWRKPKKDFLAWCYICGQLLQTLGSCYKHWAALTNIGENLKKTSKLGLIFVGSCNKHWATVTNIGENLKKTSKLGLTFFTKSSNCFSFGLTSADNADISANGSSTM